MTREEITFQSPEDVRLQKNRISLLCSANALILFAAWTVVRSIIQFYFHADAIRVSGVPQSMILMVVVFGGLDCVLKIIIGISGRAEARGTRKKSIYLVLGIILAACTVVELIYMIFSYSAIYASEGFLGLIITLAVEATVLFAEVDLIISAFNVRKLENAIAARKTEKGGDR